MCRVPVNSGVRKLLMLSNVIVDIAFPRRSFVSSQSSCKVPASLTDVGGVAVGATDLVNCSLSVPVLLSSSSVRSIAPTTTLPTLIHLIT